MRCRYEKSLQFIPEEANRIQDLMLNRNHKGATYERAGEIDKAIRVFRQNALDMFDGNYPYDRLRILYTKKKDFKNAIWACKRYAEMADTMIELGCPRVEELTSKKEKFLTKISV